jgi:hypothetical protein
MRKRRWTFEDVAGFFSKAAEAWSCVSEQADTTDASNFCGSVASEVRKARRLSLEAHKAMEGRTVAWQRLRVLASTPGTPPSEPGIDWNTVPDEARTAEGAVEVVISHLVAQMTEIGRLSVITSRELHCLRSSQSDPSEAIILTTVAIARAWILLGRG